MLEYGFSLTDIFPYKDINYNSVLIWENTGQWKPAFLHILYSEDFFKLMNNGVFGKTMENVKKHRDIKLVTTDKRRNQLVSEPNYHTTKYFPEDLLAIEMKKIKVKMNIPLFLACQYYKLVKH